MWSVYVCAPEGIYYIGLKPPIEKVQISQEKKSGRLGLRQAFEKIYMSNENSPPLKAKINSKLRKTEAP